MCCYVFIQFFWKPKKEKKWNDNEKKKPVGFVYPKMSLKETHSKRKQTKKYEWKKRRWSWTEERARKAAKRSDGYINHFVNYAIHEARTWL